MSLSRSMVTDAATPLETDTSSRGTVVSTNQIVNLPLNGRSYADLALLAPGVRKSSIAQQPRRIVQRERHAQLAEQLRRRRR